MMKIFLNIAFLTFFIPLLGFGQCLSGNCENGYGKFKYTSGDIYIGEFAKGKPDGQGICNYASGGKYIGAWKNGQVNGYGRMYSSDGSIKDGVWKNSRYQKTHTSNCTLGDCQNGYGILWLDNFRYAGYFMNGEPSRQGVLFYDDGSKFVGECKDFKRHGIGIYFNVDKKFQEGTWENDKLIISERAIGCIKGNCKNGKGVYVYKDNTRYEGDFVNNQADGEGVCYYSDGNMYTGEWKNHNFHGNGTMYVAGGTILKGIWKNGKYVGPGLVSSYESTNSVVRKPKTWYLLIGVARYENLKKLKYTDDDTYRMYSFAKSKEGGAVVEKQLKVLVDEDATRESIIRTIAELMGEVKPEDNIIVYYSGHIFGNQLIPIDGTIDANTISLTTLQLMLSLVKAKEKVVIIDGKSSVRGNVGTYQEAFVGSDVTFIMSARENELVYEDIGLRQSVFSHYVIKGLKGAADYNKNGNITLLELFQYTREEVGNHTQHQQTPVLFGKYPSDFTLSWLTTQ